MNREHDKDAVLRRFMREFFPFAPLRKAGFFTKEMRYDYKAQAERVCKFFGYKTVFEHGAKTTEGFHLSYKDGARPVDEPFAITLKGIYE